MAHLKTPLEAAITAAREFKALLDMQPAGTLFWPRRLGGELHDSHTYRWAAELLDQAVAQHLESAECSGFERRYALPVVDIVTNDRADVPANQLKLFADITASLAQVVIQVMEERRSRGEHGGFLEIGVRFLGKADVSLKEVEGKRDVVHASSSKVVVDSALCHDNKPVDQKGGE